MPDTIHIDTRSLCLVSQDDRASISLVASDGQYYQIKLTDTQVAHITERGAGHAANALRRVGGG